jgi:hypothetical protein
MLAFLSENCALQVHGRTSTSYRLVRNQQYSVANLQVLSCLHLLGLPCSFCGVIRFLCSVVKASVEYLKEFKLICLYRIFMILCAQMRRVGTHAFRMEELSENSVLVCTRHFMWKSDYGSTHSDRIDCTLFA